MSIQMQLGEDHEVLSRDAFCSGYVDSFGKWNNGFPCPKLEEDAVFCCGTSTYRYCCTTRDEADPSTYSDNSMPLVMGVVFGTIITVILVITAICIFWKSCRSYKKRRADGGPMYRMHSSSTGSGVANMYSYSTGSLGRLDSRGGMLTDDEDVLQEVDEVAVTHPCRVSTISTVPRSFTSDRCNRVSFADSVGNSSISTATDNERQLFIEQSGAPPPYKHADYLEPEQQRIMTFPRSFSAGQPRELDVGHYQVPRSPNDDTLYRSTKF
ncbi:protein shisa-like-2B isoform X1 [Amphibalanus amphitrite]|uniref:protein shisa-like-2B isoform X1 n=1 Tax=Amphibalanus amphitrite TaxID=1232801 RepID=UPI001C90B4B2|nr:protein shisa-like-2B isoform X1 [Amphibalanus amphitrite]